MSNVSKDDIESLISILRSAVHGDKYGPTGMESIAMAIAGEGISNDVGSALGEISSAIGDVSTSIVYLADAIVEAAEKIKQES